MTTPAADRPLLIVDDERSMREFLSVLLAKGGHQVQVAASGEEAIELLDQGARFKVVMTDLKLPGIDGIGVLEHVKDLDPACQVLVMTAYATAETALSAIKKGAYDYLTKPFKVEEARIAVDRALEKYGLVSENLFLKQALEQREGYGELIGKSPAMQRVFQMVSRVAPTRTTILLQGESGTGKELIARAIHRQSGCAEGPFLPINCGAIPENLIESELFGHKKGSFTGAHADQDGLFVAAEGGTVFLDEVGELPHTVQVKLLRVLQEQMVRPVGSAQERSVQCRVIAATNRDLRDEVQAGRFREDLFYRLSVIPIELPPLRERGGDVRLLLEHFLAQFAEELSNPVQGISGDAMKLLLAHPYPGNVREMQNIMQRAVTLETTEFITVDSLSPELRHGSGLRAATSFRLTEDGVQMESIVEELERNLIAQALELTDGNKTEAAGLLGITFRSLRYRLDKYDL
jgi:two-component system, NtrC family, response regulator PilR